MYNYELEDRPEISITIIVNDEVKNYKLRKVHGLSLYVEAKDKIIVFDTGPSPEILEYNSEKIGVDLSLVEEVVISHLHSDHIGGLPYIGWVSPSIKVYLPYGISSSFIGFVKKQGLIPFEVIDWTKIDNDIFVSKPFYGPPWEQSLIIRFDYGLILITGCSHPGINNIVENVTNYFNDEVYAVIGGLHLVNAPDNVLEYTIDNLLRKISVLVPLHCTGKRAISYAMKKYSNKVLVAKAGDVIKF